MVNNVQDIQDKRIGRLFQCFSEFDVDISGNPHHPLIVIDRVKALRVYISNFDLYLLEYYSKDHKPPSILRYKLKSGFQVPKQEILEYIDTYGFNRVHPVRLIGTDLFIAGWNFKDRWLQNHKYPVFAKNRCKYYFSREIAEDIVSTYPEYKLQIL